MSFTKREKIFIILSLILLNIWITLAFQIVFEENQELKYSMSILLSIIQILIASQIDLNCFGNISEHTNQNSIPNTSNEQVMEECQNEVDEERG